MDRPARGVGDQVARANGMRAANAKTTAPAGQPAPCAARQASAGRRGARRGAAAAATPAAMSSSAADAYPTPVRSRQSGPEFTTCSPCETTPKPSASRADRDAEGEPGRPRDVRLGERPRGGQREDRGDAEPRRRRARQGEVEQVRGDEREAGEQQRPLGAGEPGAARAARARAGGRDRGHARKVPAEGGARPSCDPASARRRPPGGPPRPGPPPGAFPRAPGRIAAPGDPAPVRPAAAPAVPRAVAAVAIIAGMAPHEHHHGARPRRARPRLRAVRDAAPRPRARDDPHREGLRRSRRARRADRDLRDEGRPAQRRARRREGVGRSRVPRAGCSPTAARAIAVARLRRPPGREHRRAGEHAATSTTWSSARSARATRGRCSGCRRSGTSRAPYRSRAVSDPRGVLRDFGVELAAGDRDPRVGLDRRAALPRRADAARGHRRAGARRSSPRSSRATR